MRQTTQPIAIVSSGNSPSTNRRQRSAAAESLSGNILDERGADSSGDEQDYGPTMIQNRSSHHPFTQTTLSNRTHTLNHSSRGGYFESDTGSSNMEELLMVGSLPSSRRERRFLVSTGGQEVGGYGLSNATQITVGSNSRLLLAPKTWNPSQRSKSPPPAPLLGSRLDQERGDNISRYDTTMWFAFSFIYF